MKFMVSNSRVESRFFGESRPLNRSPLRKQILRIWQAIATWLSQEACEVNVWVTRDRLGAIAWNAYNDRTHQAIYGVSESELRRWVEKQPHQPGSICYQDASRA